MNNEWIPVKSTNIAAWRYDPETLTLNIKFLRATSEYYSYRNVPASVAEAFGNATSHGTYFIQKIKDNYKFERRS